MSDNPSYAPRSGSAHRSNQEESNIAYGQEGKAGQIDHGMLSSLGGRIDNGDCVQENANRCSADGDFAKHQLDAVGLRFRSFHGHIVTVTTLGFVPVVTNRIGQRDTMQKEILID